MSYLFVTTLMASRLLQALLESVAEIVFQGVPLATETATFDPPGVPIEGEQILVPVMVVAHLASQFMTQNSLTPRVAFAPTEI
jgi:hypothetical protein